MSSEYNNVIFFPNNISTVPYNIPCITQVPQYQYLPKSELNTYIVNPPVFVEQKNFSDFVDCEISMEDNRDISSNINSSYGSYSYSSKSKSPVSRMKNNPINTIYENNIRPRSPNIVRNNNVGLNNSYEIVQYSQNNSPMNRSNSLSNYSFQSYSYDNSPVITNNPILNNITPVMPVQNQDNPDNFNYNYASNSNYEQKLYNSPIKKKKKGKYSFPKTLTNSTIYKKNNNSPINEAEKNITSFQYNPTLFNLVPVQNYQYLVENPFLTDVNNNNFQSNNVPFNTNVQTISHIYKSQYPNNSQNVNFKVKAIENNPRTNNNNINSNSNATILNKTSGQNNNNNPFASVEARNSQISLINTNSKSKPNINNLFKSCSNTHYSSGLLINSNSNNSNSNSRRSSSLNNLNIQSFDINKEIRGKFSSSDNTDKNAQGLKNNFTAVSEKKNIVLNNNQNTNLSSNVNNIGLIQNSLNTINNTKSNLYSKPSDKFSQYMLDQINKIRNNPRSYVDIFKKAKDNIKQDKRGNLYYSGKIKVALYKGEKAFNEAISSLEKTKPMKPLIFKKDLCIEISSDKKDFNSGDYLRKKINELIKKDIKVRAFWRDIIKDAEINFLLMIVDDNPIRRGAKRKDVLNPEMKYIGINSGIIGEYFVCYTVLSDE